MISKTTLVVFCIAVLLQGCTLTITLTDTAPKIQAEAVPDIYEYSLTGNPGPATEHGWKVYGTAPDGRAMVKRLKAR